jgi:hypothetical protein
LPITPVTGLNKRKPYRIRFPEPTPKLIRCGGKQEERWKEFSTGGITDISYYSPNNIS